MYCISVIEPFSALLPPNLASSPQAIEPRCCRAGIVGGMSGIAMTEIVLDKPQIVPLVGKREAAGMAEHMGIDCAQICSCPRRPDDIVYRLSRERLPAFGNEQPRQRIISMRQPAADGAQLVARDRLFDAKTVLEAVDPDPRLREIDVFAS